ncbi:hypothetical protein HNR02_006560 [Amycolatopsis endophytica]|uniref:Uncharacterized protein n=1 Tax=Amycolatopsis endophytica TaxID=860233 RepID=A0A853BEI6_9PSEU|nr:hypothetical protein [Amycolatopsis endophytica]NYI93185.1 hypothetical protein [Amycolatopsis endophytica]
MVFGLTACGGSGGEGENGSAPERIPPEMCALASSTLDNLREAWKKDVVTLPVQVTVADVAPRGATALVPDTGILVLG